MRIIILLLSLTLFVSCTASKTKPVDLSQPLTGEQVTLTVYGMSCPLCANNLDKQLIRVPGVKSVRASLDDGSVIVGLDPSSPPTREAIAAAVETSGFTLHEIKAGGEE